MLLKLWTTPPATLLITSERAIRRSTRGSSMAGLGIALSRRPLRGDGQEHGEDRAHPRRAPEGDVPAVVLDDLVRESQAQPGALRLGREERIEHFLGLRRRDAAPGVFDLDANTPCAPAPSEGLGGPVPAGAHGEPPARR